MLRPDRDRRPEPGSAGAVSRRALMRGSLLAGGAAAVGRSLSGTGATAAAADSCQCLGQAREPFHGAHQAGIATAPQGHADFVAFDLLRGVDRSALVRLMRIWTDDAVRLTDGRPALADPVAELAGVPARLTITLGLGRGALAAAGLASAAPDWLAPLPRFKGDRLVPGWSGGDLLLQVAADDPVTVSHAVSVLVGDSVEFARVRWLQRGFHRPANTAPPGITGRNLMGQVDGTENPVPGTAAFDEIVWTAGGPHWLVGGCGLVIRRIAMDLAVWGTLDVVTKEEAMGRRLSDGAPLTGGTERTQPDFDALDDDGLPVIPQTAHIRLAHSSANSGKILRRPYNYDDGVAAGAADAGLIFAAYQADPSSQFVPIQQRLAQADVMNLWVRHIGSAVFAVPPGVQPGGYFAEALLG